MKKGIFKKMVALALSVGLIACNIQAVTAEQINYFAPVVNDEFTDSVSGWKWGSSGVTTQTITNDSVNGNVVIKNDTASRPMADYYFKNKTGQWNNVGDNFIVDFEMKTSSEWDFASPAELGFLYMDGVGNYENYVALAEYHSKGKDADLEGYRIKWMGGVVFEPAVSIGAGEWVTFRMVMNVADSTASIYAAKKGSELERFATYKYGQQTQTFNATTRIGSWKEARAFNGGLRGIRFKVPANSEFVIDNVKMYSFEDIYKKINSATTTAEIASILSGYSARDMYKYPAGWDALSSDEKEEIYANLLAATLESNTAVDETINTGIKIIQSTLTSYENDFKIRYEAVFKDADSVVTDDPSSATTISFKAHYENLSETPKQGMLIYAFYGANEKLLLVKGFNPTTFSGSDTDDSVSNVTIPAGTQKINAMFWRDSETIIPIVDNYTVAEFNNHESN